ncbi:unnamed protein product [Fusarium langsethiae]|nr:unnamed protein product [Fusarium langsethiae]
MFNLLQGYCVGSGPVLLQTTLYQFIRIKTSSYETIPQFNVEFERLVKLLLDQKEPISDTLKKDKRPDWAVKLAKELAEHDRQNEDTKSLHIRESNRRTVERSFLILEDEISNAPVQVVEKCRISASYESKPERWLFDTGSSVHICNDRHLFSSLLEKPEDPPSLQGLDCY